MKHFITLLSVMLFAIFSHAQNIVPNYSFEQDDSCPTYINNFYCTGWQYATLESPDYFNSCDTAAISIGRSYPWVGVPNNFIGRQQAYDGKAYMGINTYGATMTHYKEYLSTNIPTLQKDSIYKVSIEVSLADSCKYATDGIGVLFTTYGSPDKFFSGTLSQAPQVNYTSYGVIKDTVNWVNLSGTFIADSAYTYMMIGGFKDAGEMKVVAVNNSSTNIHTNAYYYVDAIIVEKLSSTGITNVNSIDDVRIYPNPFTESATLQFNNPFSNNYTFTLFNVQGQIARQLTQISSDRIQIERNDLPSGLYYYQLCDERNIVANGKIIIV